jgi:uncharacterized membrane protein YczE
MVAVLHDSIDDQPGEMSGNLAPVAVFETDHDVTSTPCEWHGCVYPVFLGSWRTPDQSKTASGTHGRPRCIASGAASHEEHVVHHDDGVYQAVPSRYRAGVHRFIPTDRAVERITRCVIGLACFGVGISMLIDADLGAAPWDVFHTGISELTGWPVGTVIIVTGIVLLLLWIPLGETPGLGTVLNAFEIGIVVDLALPILPEPEAIVPRALMMLGGIVVIAIGSGLYIGAGLGAGPRDGLMTGLARRGWSISAARTGIEMAVLLAGVALGGSIGVGTAAFALGIGPLVQLFLPRLRMSERTLDPSPARSTCGPFEV